MERVEKSKIIELFYELNYRRKVAVKISFFGDHVQLSIGKNSQQMTMKQAHSYLEGLLKEYPPPRNSQGRGYIERSMSVNAHEAYQRGMRPKSQFNSEILNSLGFCYPVNFFRWLIDSKYILPIERHHTSAAKKYTNFFSDSSVKYAVRMMNLDLLYRIFKNEITKQEAKRLRGIQYAQVRLLDTLIGGKSGKVLTVNCIICDDYIFISDKRCFKREDPRAEVIRVYDDRPDEFQNSKLKRLADKLLKRKTKSFNYFLVKDM